MQRSMDERIEERARDVGQVSAEHPVPPWLPSVARLNQTVGQCRCWRTMTPTCWCECRALWCTKSTLYSSPTGIARRDSCCAAPQSSHCRGSGLKSLRCQIAPSGPGFEVENKSHAVQHLDLLRPAPAGHHQPLFRAERVAADRDHHRRRGVAVELFVGEIGDQFLVFHAQHSYYQSLLEAGVRIYLYPAPAILHAKHMSVDEFVTVVGSSNMDMRSFSLDLELSLMTCGREFSDEMRAVEDGYRRLSCELTLQEWSRRSRGHGLVDDLARLTSAVQ
jgi:PLD-like domain